MRMKDIRESYQQNEKLYLTPLYLEIFDFKGTQDLEILKERVMYNSINLFFMYRHFEHFSRFKKNEYIVFTCCVGTFISGLDGILTKLET